MTLLKKTKKLIKSLRSKLFQNTDQYSLNIINEAIPENFRIGRNSIFGSYTQIINQGGKLIIGNDFKMGIGANLITLGGTIEIGNRVVINNYSIVYGNGGVSIGDDTQIAAHCVIIPANHKHGRLDIPIARQGETRKGIKIGNDVWIGANVTILDGVEIGDGAIIGASSVVRDSILPNTISAGVPAKVIKNRVHEELVDFEVLNMWLVNYIYEKECLVNSKMIDEVLKYKSENVDTVFIEERAFPGDDEFMENGYYKTMLKRYVFAGSFLCKEKKVLDSCSGFGWGTYILSNYANTVVAFDLEEAALQFCKSNWDRRNVSWTKGNALDISFLDGEAFDVVTAFETIEHFTKSDGEKYISQMALALKKGGFIVGTSSFPENELQAEKLCKTNPYHLHVFTFDEISIILKKYFDEYVIIDNWMFVARK
ncbi:methyltransferase domain-containing protein [Peijinzhouia sedimentorum]